MSREPRTVCISGYYSPPHRGHLEYMQRAKELAGGDQGRLVVIVNSDKQALLKKGYSFVPEEERLALVAALRWVDEVVLSVDSDRTVRATLRMLVARGTLRPGDVFAQGGDRNNGEIPEASVCRELGLGMVDGLGDKIQSSSWLIEHAIAVARSVEDSKTYQL